MKENLRRLEIMGRMNLNAFLYYLSRLPLIGLLIQPKAYGHYKVKQGMSSLGVLHEFYRGVMGKIFMLLLLVIILPNTILAGGGSDPKPELMTQYLLIYLFVFCLFQKIGQSQVFNSVKEDYTFLKQFMFNPKTYYQSKVISYALKDFVFQLPILYLIFQDIYLVGLLSLVNLSGDLALEAIYLVWFRKRGALPKRFHRAMISTGLCILAYVLILLNRNWDIFKLPNIRLWGWGLALGAVILGTISIAIIRSFSNYKEIARRYSNQSSAIISVTVSSGFDVDEDLLKEYSEDVNRGYFEENFKGDEKDLYLTKVLHHRMSKVLKQMVQGNLNGLIFFLLSFLILTKTKLVEFPLSNLTTSSILLGLGIMNLFSTSYLETNFRFIDLPLLKHGIKRVDSNKSHIYREMKILGMNLKVLGILFLFLLMVSSLFQGNFSFWGMIKIALAAFFLLNTFELLWQAIYIFLDPYTSALNVKTPHKVIIGILAMITGSFMIFKPFRFLDLHFYGFFGLWLLGIIVFNGILLLKCRRAPTEGIKNSR